MPSKGGARSVDKRQRSDEDSAPIDSADPKMQVSRESPRSARYLAYHVPPAVTPMSCYTCVKFLNAEKLSKGQSEGKRAADREMRASFSLRPF